MLTLPWLRAIGPIWRRSATPIVFAHSSRIAGIHPSCRLPLMSTNEVQVIVPPIELNVRYRASDQFDLADRCVLQLR